ncbi:hypothetical protein KKF81_00360 [Candidatus Micrarchaeota archaeon]|nr:hypothetical protein [Candidatus Micrarchaeota archaeon]MBU1165370.1 hypothetical protein [Candidatus Micrarchaeota archaeon]MBU1886231.1 hypothetical protein [Candidatus Micrarchaeota archaeon]
MKGQYFSFDAIIASVIFILALIALLSYWHSIKSFLDFQNDQISMEAIKVSNLMFTPPDPHLACASVERLGLAMSWQDRRLNASAIECAELRGEPWVRKSFDTYYNISLVITNVGDSSATPIELGVPVPDDAENVAKIRRLATVLNDDGTDYLAIVDLSLYN